MRLDLTVNLLTMHALSRGRITVFGGAQVRPNIHIDDLVDLYLFLMERRLAGIFNAGVREPHGARDRRRSSRAQVPAEIVVTASDDPRSYRLSSTRLLATGFAPDADGRDRRARAGRGLSDGRAVGRSAVAHREVDEGAQPWVSRRE